jgi:hypothetical protein
MNKGMFTMMRILCGNVAAKTWEREKQLHYGETKTHLGGA